ncbi:polysaccharide deacetylase family protein [Siphonobacter sp. SORGH_AS_0500]|uniref:polysaccharide deacetylase family protein n=1 Tax=Siphonobacter sp. SORGH_AS_0500 TaxID=1864824 RepID=UPI002854F25A|nr:polysaccharide deacetylase family protein [Siphonobacter sp. SORGH_AS_0500]MDR6196442.1 peptidoglycan/xylan/chitin deacetylase (PgdA/CDA1 family) [Siphonobacter sp. SORGH_AS_0500]
MSFHKLLVFFLLLISLFGCDTPPKHPERAGVALSFDDHFLKEWAALIPLFRKYNAQVTFFINCPDSLSAEDISLLRQLQNEGHEIGYHGTIHGVSTQMIQDLGVEGYLNTEIRPGLSYLNKAGFYPTSYAHPGGNHNTRVDSVLLTSGFQILRDVALAERHYKGFKLYHIPPRYLPQIYYDFDQERVVDALLIDYSANLSQEEMKDALVKAKEKGKAVLLFGHEPLSAPPTATQYGFDISFMEKILATAQELNLKFYRMSDLPNVKD